MEFADEVFGFVEASLNLFKVVPNLENEKFPEYVLSNERNLRHGFFVTEKAFRVCPCVAGKKIFDFIKNKFGYDIFELNQGFYKSFQTVANSTPQKILVNKILHYMSTYGMESLGILDRELVYIPNDVLELPANATPLKITVIDAIDKDEIETRAIKMIQSGAALSKETINNLAVVVNFLDIKPNVQGKKNYIPENFNYTVPVSEKKFVGNIPYGSSYTFSNNSVVVGVHWFNLVGDGSEERVDLDLHLNSPTTNFGWYNDFDKGNFVNTKERKIIFSGDMTDAPIANGGATEAFFLGESLKNEMVTTNLNHYNRMNDSKPVPFKLILADVAQENIDRKYLIDSHEIAFCVPGEISSGEMFLGFLVSNSIGEKKFYFFSGNTGSRNVARSDELTEKYISAMSTTFESFLSLEEILRRAGAIFKNVDATNCDINLSPAEVTKDILIGLFAK